MHAAARAIAATTIDVGLTLTEPLIHAVCRLTGAFDAAPESAVRIAAAAATVFARFTAAAAVDVRLVAVRDQVIAARLHARNERILGQRATDSQQGSETNESPHSRAAHRRVLYFSRPPSSPEKARDRALCPRAESSPIFGASC